MRQAGGPEEFLAMRASYAASLAAVSITGYITGAGDRHLENFLLHTASGTLIPIDFGYGCAMARLHSVLHILHLRGGVMGWSMTIVSVLESAVHIPISIMMMVINALAIFYANVLMPRDTSHKR